MKAKWNLFVLSLVVVASASAQAGQKLDNQPFLQQIFSSVSQDNLTKYLRDMTGYNEVTLNGTAVKITDRYSAQGKQNFRAYFSQFFTQHGFSVSEMAYTTQHTDIEAQGHNVEAVLPGKSKDSVVIIVHYDSMGISGQETANPAVDDDMTGMATSLESARIISELVKANKATLGYTVRFVAADFEEWTGPGLEGAREYAKYIQAKAKAEGFKIVAAIDNEQSGWSCSDEGKCSDPQTVDIYSCSGDGYDNPALGDTMEQITKSFSSLQTNRGCMGENSDHYAMWEIGVPSVVYSEHNAFDNPHFDATGGDILETINLGYYFKISQVGVTALANLAQLTPTATFLQDLRLSQR